MRFVFNHYFSPIAWCRLCYWIHLYNLWKSYTTFKLLEWITDQKTTLKSNTYVECCVVWQYATLLGYFYVAKLNSLCPLVLRQEITLCGGHRQATIALLHPWTHFSQDDSPPSDPTLFYTPHTLSMPFVITVKMTKKWSGKVQQGSCYIVAFTLKHQKKILCPYSWDSLLVSWPEGKCREMKCTFWKREGNSAHYSLHFKGSDWGFPVQVRECTVISYCNSSFYYTISLWS